MKRLFLALAVLAVLVGSAHAQGPCSSGPGVNCTVNPVFTIPLDTLKSTYSVAAAAYVPAAAATDIMQICGSATKTIRVTEVAFGGRATAAANVDVQLVRRNAANTGGTSVTETAASYDSTQAAATAVVLAYTANPVITSLVGAVSAVQVFIGNLTTGQPNPSTIFQAYGNGVAKAIVLRGAAQCLSVNLNGGTFSGNVVDVTMEWTEE